MIQFKRGSGTPPALAAGEPAFDTAGHVLYVGDGSSNTAFGGMDLYYTQGDVDTLLTGYAPVSHTHAQADVTGLTSALAAKVPTTTTISTTAPLTGGGDLSANRTLAISDFVASGAGHARGAVPDPGASAGTTRFLREDATWQVPAGGSSPLTGRVTADRTTSSTTLSAITDLDAFTLSANTVYRFRAVLFVTTNATTVGIHFGVNFTGTTTHVRAGHAVNPVTAPTAAGSAVAHGAATAVNTKILATTAGPGTSPSIVVLEGLIEVGASGGTFSFQFASETATVTTVQRGSFAVVESIT